MFATHSVFFTIKILLLLQGVMSQFLEPDCIDPGILRKIMNGQIANIVNTPWKAYIYEHNAGVAQFVCWGTLIHKQLVLTAAQCVSRNRILAVRFAEDSTSWLYAVTQVFQNKLFTTENFGHDIAILQIEPEVHFNAFIRPVCIITDPKIVPNVKTFRAAGWGRTENGNTLSRVRKAVELNELNVSECNNMLGINLTESQICAGRPQDNCVDGRGGPLIHLMYMNGSLQYVQLGIASFGRPDCRSVVVYTRLSSFIDWILMVVIIYTVRSPPMIQFQRGSFGK